MIVKSPALPPFSALLFRAVAGDHSATENQVLRAEHDAMVAELTRAGGDKRRFTVNKNGCTLRLRRGCPLGTVTTPTRVLAIRLTIDGSCRLAVSRADVIQPTVELPPASGAYDFGGIRLAGTSKSTENALVSGFDVLIGTTDGNEVVDANATYTADIFADNTGVPALFLGIDDGWYGGVHLSRKEPRGESTRHFHDTTYRVRF
jgi:hypothetical protein